MKREKQFLKKTKTKAAVLFFVLLITGALFFSACDLYGLVGGTEANIPGSLPFLLRGKWAYTQPGNSVPAELYTITGATIEYGYGGGSSVYDFSGTVEFVSNYSAGSGVIIVKYDPAKKPRYPLYNNGSFGAVYYRNLRADAVQLANAINLSDMSAPDTAALDEAVEKFTRTAMGAYVNWGNVQPQRRIGE
ncbi:MAG: hypothetical protein LBG10_05365 [Treponema sp.]|jgi:hypothetical protein|nr:hypothetical protein [Treponema sp.]